MQHTSSIRSTASFNSTPKSKSKPRSNLQKIEEYASRARNLAYSGEAARLLPLCVGPNNGQSRALAVETSVANEISARRPAEEPINFSFDVHGSTAMFAPQRGIDIGLWAAGSGFKITARGGWYSNETVACLRKFLRTNSVWQTVTALFVFLSLFLSDFFVLLQVPTNIAQDSILTAVIATFVAEFLGLCATDLTYPLSFFFWMDMIGTLSMIFDVSFMLGADATEPYHVSERSSSGGNVLIMRAGNAARLGARAGRLSRVLKIMRYLTAFQRVQREGVKKEDEVKMAKAIANQLNDVLSTRVAFFTICIAVIIPCFSMFDYPEMDDSMGAWTKSLATDADGYFDALRREDPDIIAIAKEALLMELERFSRFYGEESYGPFRVCLGSEINGEFECQHQKDFDLTLDTPFQEPTRKQSIWVTSAGRAKCFFNLETPRRLESGASMILIVFLIITMVAFSMVMTHTVSAIALQPLERMLGQIRERCAEIFKFTSQVQGGGEADQDEEHEKKIDDDWTVINEFVLLEKAVSKLAAIADLSSSKTEPEVTETMDDQDMLMLNLRGVQVPSAAEHRQFKSMLVRGGSSLNRSDSWLGKSSSDRLSSEEQEFELLDKLSSVIPGDVRVQMETESFDSSDLSKGLKLPKDEDKRKSMPSWVALYIVCRSPGCLDWVNNNIPEDAMRKFASVIESKYLPNPFHNFAHALDVCWTISRTLQLVEADMFLTEASQCWLMIAALGHDIGHEGFNNAYLVERSHQWALTYNDRSPLENMHCASLFQVLGDDETNIFKQVDSLLYKEIRKGIIAAILHTDIVKHSEMVKSLALLYQMNTEIVEEQDEDFFELINENPTNTQNMINMFLHCADVGNPMKPWELCQKLSFKVMEEFFSQGDLEKLHGIPVSMLNDRNKVNIPNSQIGFIEFMIAPMVESVVRLFPALDTLAQNLCTNMHNWLDVWNEKSTPPQDAYDKVHTRVEKVCASLMDVAA